MRLNVQSRLNEFLEAAPGIEGRESMQLPDAVLETDDIRIVMISEAVPKNPDDFFYSRNPDAAYLSTAIPILNEAGLDVRGMDDVIHRGIYITTAIKTPKEGYAVPTGVIASQLPILEQELALFSHLKAILLMGDVAKKAFNMIARKRTGKNLIPSQPTYRIRGNEYMLDGIRVFPSYIITGGNLLIEKGKIATIREDIASAMALLKP
ncbi:MAG: hypothetical protein J1E43_02735 [Christensenellaceae bacterium]|nr:hypothetical protein [Christensenellaceae bacterium]